MTNNNHSNRNYSGIALVLSGLALVSTFLFLITKGLLTVGLFTGATSDALNRGLLISAGLVILFAALYVVLEPDKVRQAIIGRKARYGSNTLILSIAFVGILFVANALVFKYPQRWDLTEDKVNTLAPETIEALNKLPEPVTAVAFYSSGLSTESANELLQNFKSSSNGKFDFRFVNPDTDPVAAREAGITGDGKILLILGERREIASFASETELTKTLIRLINPNTRAVYFLTGHGEASIEPGENSFSTAKRTLESKNYAVNSLNLIADKKIPEDALVIIIAGPQKPLTDSEAQILKEFVDAGGALVVMENPILFTQFGEAPDPLASYLSSDWGITLDNNIIIDQTGSQLLEAISYSASQHPITANLSQNYIVVMPQARTISLAQGSETVTLTGLLFTSPNSWGETDFQSAEGIKVSFEADKDLPGPLTMAAAGENTSTKGRVVVFGNSLFATDQAFDYLGNGNMFVNSVDWAAEQEDLLNITPNTPKERTFVPPSQIQMLIIWLSAVVIIPGLIVLAGVSTWLARRRRG